MKKIFILLLSAALINVSTAVAPFDGAKPVKATEVMIPVGNTGNKISLLDLSKLTPSAYEELAHVKLNFFERLGYKRVMRKLRNSIAADGTIKNKNIAKLAAPAVDGSEGFHLGGAALGFLLGLLGVLIAYLIKDENKPNRVKWAWIGLGAALVISLLFLL